MRYAAGCLLSALTLFTGGAAGMLETWALPAGAVIALIAAVVAAVAMEERDGSAIESLVTRSDPPQVGADMNVSAATPPRQAA